MGMCDRPSRINRNIVECKGKSVSTVAHEVIGFNRNIVECKAHNSRVILHNLREY